MSKAAAAVPTDSENRNAFRFASRATYFPMNVDDSANVIEREYLLGGGKSAEYRRILSRDIDAPLPKNISQRVLRWSNFTLTVCSGVWCARV